MKDVTIQVIKSEQGYRLIVIDDRKTEDNTEGWKSNGSKSVHQNKEQVNAHVESILKDLE